MRSLFALFSYMPRSAFFFLLAANFVILISQYVKYGFWMMLQSIRTHIEYG